MATRLLDEPSDDESRLTSAFLKCTGREPDSTELTILAAALDEQRKVFAQLDPDNKPTSYISMGEKGVSNEHDAVELAALTATCQMILNLDATVWKR
jgi:hypothetical protein